MAKDGTNRGGRRVRAGGKPYALVDKISAGKYLHVALDAAKDGNLDKDTIDNLNDALKRI